MKIGTPENPEIIEPGQGPRPNYQGPRPQYQAQGAQSPFGSASPSGRFRRAFQLLSLMVKLSLPALFIDSACFWLMEMGRTEGGFFAWALLLMLALPAFFLTLIAVLSNLLLGVLFIATLLGKNIAVNQMPMMRFVRFGNRTR